jgi:hypothetical protein
MKSKLAGVIATLFTTTTVLGAFAIPAKAISLGGALGIAAGGAAAGILLDNNIKAEHDRHSYHSPQAEYDRGFRDGEQRLKYDNPSNSVAYNRGYENGIQRSAYWRANHRDYKS